MARMHLVVAAALALAVSAHAQQQTAQPSTMDKVKSWTQKKWDATKAELQKDKAKWDACNQQSNDRHLTGRASWSFIYDCMKKS